MITWMPPPASWASMVSWKARRRSRAFRRMISRWSRPNWPRWLRGSSPGKDVFKGPLKDNTGKDDRPGRGVAGPGRFAGD